MGATTTSFSGPRVRIDWQQRSVTQDGAEFALGDRALDLLAALLARAGQVLDKGTLMQAVWPGMVVTDTNLHVQVNALRKLLGADAIVNSRGRGYALVLPPDAEPEKQLFGREALIARLLARLADPGERWITLAGPGGVGKTRVADAAFAAATGFEQRLRVDLAPLSDPERLSGALLQAFGLQPFGVQDRLLVLAQHLQGRRVLLVLDNLEQLAPAGAWLQALLEATPALTLLVTSRSLLRQPLERALPVEPLSTPSPQHTLAAARETDAVRLFMQRARGAGSPLPDDPPAAAPPDAGASPETAAAVEICARLGGLPLAIELAAARLKLMSARALNEQLGRRQPLLGAGRDVQAHRQRSLDDTLQWSLDLLPAGAAALLPRLALARGGVDLDAAVALDAEASPATTLDRLTVLLEHHLLQREDDAGGRPRYRMLEPVRDLGAVRLAASADAEIVADRQAAHYAALAERWDQDLRASARAAAIRCLVLEQHNLRVALQHLIQRRRDAIAALRLVGRMAWGWYFLGDLLEGRQWLAQALALPAPAALSDTASDAAPPPALAAQWQTLRAHALSGDAKLALYLGDAGGAMQRGHEAVALARQAGADEVLAYALFHLAIPTQVKSPPDAVALHDEARTIFMRLGDRWGQALTTVYGGIPLAFAPQQTAAAEARLREGQQQCLALGDEWLASAADHYLGVMALRRGDLVAARAHAQAALAVAETLNDGFRVASIQLQQGRIALAAGRHDEAGSLFSSAAALHARQGRRGFAGQLLKLLARHAIRQGDLKRAARLVGASAVDHGPAMIQQLYMPDELAECQRAFEQLPEKLGTAAHAALLAEGGTLGLDQALELGRVRR